jgi:hypothetical protein
MGGVEGAARGGSASGARGGTGTLAAGTGIGGIEADGFVEAVGDAVAAGGAGGAAAPEGTARSGAGAVGKLMLEARAAADGDADPAPAEPAETPLLDAAAAREAPSRPTANTALQTLHRARTPPSGILAGSTR